MPAEDLLVRDSYRSTAALSILIALWLVVVTLFGLPFSPTYYAARLTAVALALLALAYIARTWHRPRLGVCLLILTMETVGVATLIAWGGWLGAQSGEQWEPIAGVQLTIAAIPLVTPPFAWVGYLLLAGFSAELVTILYYQQHLGLGPLPAAEPFASLCIALVAVAVLMIREERRQMSLAFIRLSSEEGALSRLAPALTSIHDELENEIQALGCVAREADAKDRAFVHSLDRLGVLSGQLDSLSARSTGLGDEERSLLARDSHAGAFVFSICGVAAASLAAWGARALPLAHFSQLLWVLALIYALIAAWLWTTRHQPSRRRGVLASVLLVALAWLVGVYGHIHWAQLSVLAFPFLGHKLLLLTVVLFRMPRLWTGVTVLASIAASDFALTWVLSGQLAPLEPWHTLMLALIGLGFLAMGEERRIASIDLLHAEANVSSLRRRASLSLAVCDQLNTPLQTVSILIGMRPPTEATKDASSHLERLATLGQQLSRVTDELPELRHVSLNGAFELRRRV